MERERAREIERESREDRKRARANRRRGERIYVCLINKKER